MPIFPPFSPTAAPKRTEPTTFGLTALDGILAAISDKATGTASASGAPWPVWSGSTTSPVEFTPMPKRKLVKIWHRARDFDKRTKIKGRHGGAVGHAALQVLHALIFDFFNHRTGRVDPGYAALARAANVCERTVASALARLKSLGILSWVRRCSESVRDGRHVIEQETNAYTVLPETAWRGYTPPADPPAPLPCTWGAAPAMATPTGDLGAAAIFLAAEAANGPSAALASLARAMAAREAANPR